MANSEVRTAEVSGVTFIIGGGGFRAEFPDDSFTEYDLERIDREIESTEKMLGIMREGKAELLSGNEPDTTDYYAVYERVMEEFDKRINEVKDSIEEIVYDALLGGNA